MSDGRNAYIQTTGEGKYLEIPCKRVKSFFKRHKKVTREQHKIIGKLELSIQEKIPFVGVLREINEQTK